MKPTLIQGNIKQGILLFAIPLFLSNFFQQLYNTVDTLLIGHFLGDAPLAALGATTAIFELIVQFCSGMSLGFGIVISRYYGAKDTDKLKIAIAESLIFGFFIALFLSIVSCSIMPWLLRILKTPNAIYSMAYSYIHVIAATLIITMFYNLAACLFRSIGNSLTPLYVLIITSIVNVILDTIFITQWHIGIRGAAFATVLSQVLAALLCFGIIYKKEPLLVPKRNHFKMDADIVHELLSQGFAMGFMFSIVSIGTIILQSGINPLGTNIIAAHTAARKWFALLVLPLSTLGATTSTFVSQNRGAKQWDRMEQGIRFCIHFDWLYTIVLTVIVFLFAQPMIHILSGSANDIVLANGTRYLQINIPGFIVLGPLLTYRNALQGNGYKIYPLISSGIELAGKIVFTIWVIPALAYFGVILCEPVIWTLMSIQLWISYRIIKTENTWKRANQFD